MAQGRVPDFAGAHPRAELNDPGRAWSGDLFTTGAPTDPAAAFAQFSGGEDGAQAWLDKQDDGTLVGWVSQDGQTWRYSDPRTWASDVDAAQMQRTDAPGGAPDPFAPGAVEDDSQMPANQTSTDFGPDVPDEENPFLKDDAPDLNNIVGDLNDAELEQQAAVEGQMPLDPEAPTDAGQTGVVTDEAGEPVDQEPAADEPGAEEAPEVDPEAEQEAAPEAEPGGEVKESDEDPVEEATETPAEEDAEPDEDEDDPKKKGNPFAKEKKHYPGGHSHNQQDHGDWADKLPGGHFPASSPNSRESRAGGDSGSADPKAGKPGGDSGGNSGDGPKGTGKPRPKVKVDPASIEKMNASELEAVWSGQDIYDHDTLMAVSKRYDELEPVKFEDFGDDHDAEQAAFRGAVPEAYVAWVAGGKKSKPKGPNKKTSDADRYFDHIYAQWLRAEEITRGNFWSRRGKAKARKMGWGDMALFDGGVRSDALKLYASDELLQFFADDGHVTLAEFVAQKTNSAYLSEFG